MQEQLVQSFDLMAHRFGTRDNDGYHGAARHTLLEKLGPGIVFPHLFLAPQHIDIDFVDESRIDPALRPARIYPAVRLARIYPGVDLKILRRGDQPRSQAFQGPARCQEIRPADQSRRIRGPVQILAKQRLDDMDAIFRRVLERQCDLHARYMRLIDKLHPGAHLARGRRPAKQVLVEMRHKIRIGRVAKVADQGKAMAGGIAARRENFAVRLKSQPGGAELGNGDGRDGKRLPARAECRIDLTVGQEGIQALRDGIRCVAQ